MDPKAFFASIAYTIVSSCHISFLQPKMDIWNFSNVMKEEVVGRGWEGQVCSMRFPTHGNLQLHDQILLKHPHFVRSWIEAFRGTSFIGTKHTKRMMKVVGVLGVWSTWGVRVGYGREEVGWVLWQRKTLLWGYHLIIPWIPNGN